MKHRIPHDLTPALAQKATRKALEAYRDEFPQFQPGGRWSTDDHATIWFVTPVGRIEGDVRVLAKHVELHITKIPFVARAFKSQAIRIVETEVKAWIKRAKNGELD